VLGKWGALALIAAWPFSAALGEPKGRASLKPDRFAAALPCRAQSAPQVVPLGGKAIGLSVERAQACAVLESGRLVCWGHDEFDQLGIAPDRPVARPPTENPRLTDVVEVALTRMAGCARHRSGAVSCFGHREGWDIALAEGAFPQPPATLRADQIAVGTDHACGLSKGQAHCWGALERWAAFPAKEPRVPGVSGATAIAAYDRVDCAVSGGAVFCWGDVDGQREQRPTARRVPKIDDAVAVSVGLGAACAVRKNGKIACWSADRLGDPWYKPPVDLPGIDDARQLAVGHLHSCALRATGQIACWGWGNHGERGDGRVDRSDTPSTVVGIDNAVAVGVGTGISCALLADGRVTCWGKNDHGQLGFDNLATSAKPLDVCGLDRVTQIATGFGVTCAIREPGDVYCWGAGHEEQLGPGRREHSATPVRVHWAQKVVEIVASDNEVCIRDRAGQVGCWGARGRNRPTLREPVTQIALGMMGLCALTRDGAIVCNGKRVPGVAPATRVSVGGNFACAQVGASAVCWGEGMRIHGSRCMGDVCESVDPGPGPRPLVEEPNNELVSCKEGLPCARTADGRLLCGVPARPLYDRPLQCGDSWDPKVGPLVPDAIQVARTQHHGCALRKNGLVACWGDNAFGQLGQGTMSLVAAPAR
jgi:alpha-tubulin suppressor-like RCC1 family protein